MSTVPQSPSGASGTTFFSMFIAAFVSAFITVPHFLQMYRPLCFRLVLSMVLHVLHFCEVYDSLVSVYCMPYSSHLD
jgi:hypothetical protein